jgi:uncharacterized protein (TIGR02246 family)
MKALGMIAGAVALTTIGLSAQQPKAAAGDEAAIAKVRAAYQTAASAQDAAGLAKLFAPDGIEMPQDAPMAKGRAAIEAYHKQLASQVMNHGTTITSTEMHVMGDRAVDIGTYKQTLMMIKGGTGMVDDKGKYVVLLKKDASGHWWVTDAIYNSDAPMAPPKK